jgi:DNA topoisomerase-3
MNQLIIAEKPSVAQSIAAVLGAKQRREGYIEGNSYLVSWCFGHLAELANAETYNIEYAKWRYSDLPIMPQPWRFKVNRDKYKQFEILKTLMRREDVGEVVNACDAGREGELIFRTAYQLAGCSKPMKRLWISSMEDEAIRSGFKNLRPGSEYDNLHQSALCRAKADWLVGINATRLFSTLYHRTLNVGRVMSPTLALIAVREAEIEAFKSKPFYTINLEFDSFSAVSEKYSEKARAEAVAEACHEDVAKVTKVERKEKSEKAPPLYDLTTLQRDANRALGYTAQQTLDYLQSLYEKKLCTYPRTDARFLTDDMEANVPDYVAVAAALCKADTPEDMSAKQVCNSGKVSDHHAIIATVSVGKADITALPAGEREILLLIAKRVLCAVCKPHRYTETVVQMMCREVPFTAKGKTVLEAGWKKYADHEQSEASLPELSEGDVLIPGEELVKEGKTTPPKRFTEDTLLAAMETAGEKDMPEDAERRGLGTPATRAAILEKLVNTGFVERKKAKKTVSLVPSHTGVSLVTVLPEQLQSPLLTAQWEQQLKQVERGELDADSFLDGIAAMLQELVQTYKAIPGAEVLFPSGREVVGRCPRCGGDVTESKKGYFCEKNDCRFGLWRDNKFLTAKKVTLTKPIAAALLTDGRVKLTGLYSEKTGNSYDATVVLEDDGQRLMYKLVFDNG